MDTNKLPELRFGMTDTCQLDRSQPERYQTTKTDSTLVAGIREARAARDSKNSRDYHDLVRSLAGGATPAPEDIVELLDRCGKTEQELQHDIDAFEQWEQNIASAAKEPEAVRDVSAKQAAAYELLLDAELMEQRRQNAEQRWRRASSDHHRARDRASQFHSALRDLDAGRIVDFLTEEERSAIDEIRAAAATHQQASSAVASNRLAQIKADRNRKSEELRIEQFTIAGDQHQLELANARVKSAEQELAALRAEADKLANAEVAAARDVAAAFELLTRASSTKTE